VFCDRVKKLGTDDAPIRAIHRDIAWTQIALGFRKTRSPLLTIFCHCGFRAFSSRTALERGLGNKPSTVLAEDRVPKGLAMLIRSEKFGVRGGAASAVRARAIPAAFLPTLSIGGLLLLIGP